MNILRLYTFILLEGLIQFWFLIFLLKRSHYSPVKERMIRGLVFVYIVV